MTSMTRIAGLILSAAALLCCGCGTVTTDRLSRDTPRGYVEFQNVTQDLEGRSIEGGVGPVKVYELVRGKLRSVGEYGYWSKRRRVALEPGSHSFVLRPAAGTGQIATKVEVYKDMLTPVKVIYTNAQDQTTTLERAFGGSRLGFRWHAEAEPAVGLSTSGL